MELSLERCLSPPGSSSTRCGRTSRSSRPMVATACARMRGSSMARDGRSCSRMRNLKASVGSLGIPCSLEAKRSSLDAYGSRPSLCPPSAPLEASVEQHAVASLRECYLVDPAGSHMLVSKIKPCMCKYELIGAVKLRNGSLNRL